MHVCMSSTGESSGLCCLSVLVRRFSRLVDMASNAGGFLFFLLPRPAPLRIPRAPQLRHAPRCRLAAYPLTRSPSSFVLSSRWLEDAAFKLHGFCCPAPPLYAYLEHRNFVLALAVDSPLTP